MKPKNFERFGLGALVIPARDGMLKALGHRVPELGRKALGLVLEPRKNKAFIAFPELALQVWLDHDEMADLYHEAGRGEAAYRELLPDYAQAQLPMVYWVNRAYRELKAHYILSVEKAKWNDVWDENLAPLQAYTALAAPERIEKFSVGLEELILPEWKKFCDALGSRLFFTRILPAGLHKIEAIFYLRAIEL